MTLFSSFFFYILLPGLLSFHRCARFFSRLCPISSPFTFFFSVFFSIFLSFYSFSILFRVSLNPFSILFPILFLSVCFPNFIFRGPFMYCTYYTSTRSDTCIIALPAPAHTRKANAKLRESHSMPPSINRKHSTAQSTLHRAAKRVRADQSAAAQVSRPRVAESKHVSLSSSIYLRDSA